MSSKEVIMRKIRYRTGQHKRGFSIAEVLAALVIGAMVLVATLGIYNRAERSIVSIKSRLDSTELPREVLQRIAEDLDKIIAPGSDTRVNIESKYDLSGFATARLEIVRTYYDKSNSVQTLEQIVWLTSPDYDSSSKGLVLYRSHSGKIIEDKLLDESKEDWERSLFVPVCEGVTFFSLQVPKEEELLDKWNGSIPGGIVATISFAEPFLDMNNLWDVFEEEKFKRTIAVDRSRKIKFEILTQDPNSTEESGEDLEESEKEDLSEEETEGGKDTNEPGI